MDSGGERVMLGKGSFGAVYSAIDLVTKRKMAVKELSDTGYVSHSMRLCDMCNLLNHTW